MLRAGGCFQSRYCGTCEHSKVGKNIGDNVMKYTRPSIMTKICGTKPLTANFAPPPPDEPTGPEDNIKSVPIVAKKNNRKS